MGGGYIAERDGGEFLMTDYLTTNTELTSIANAIRAKGGTSSSLVYPAGFVSAINAIPSGSSVIVEALSVTQNGTYSATSGKAYSPVTVNVSGSRGIKYAKFEMTASDTFTFVEGYPLTYSEFNDDCFFCGLALSSNQDVAYISGINPESMLMFGFYYSQSAVPASILNYNNGIITIDNVDTFEQGFLYAFIPDFDFDTNIATMSEFKSYLGIT